MFSKFGFFGLVSILLFSLTTETSIAQDGSKNKQLRTSTSLFRTTPTEQIIAQESTLLEQAIQDKIETQFDTNNDRYDQDFRWAAQMKERGILDDEQIRGIAKNRAANRARKSFEAMIDGSDLERAYKKLEKGIKSIRDYSTVEIGQKKDGKIIAHKLKEEKDSDENPVAVFYLQPDLNNGVSAVIDTKRNVRMEYQPSDNRLVVGYQINF